MRKIPNYPKVVNGKPLFAKYPTIITHDMIIVATKDKLRCARDMRIGKFMAVCIWHNRSLMAGNSRIFDTFDQCQVACDIWNNMCGYDPVYVEEIKAFSLKNK